MNIMNQHMRLASLVHQITFQLEKDADALLTSRLNISFVQLMTLKIVSFSASHTQKDLAECMNVSAGAVSRQIEGLRSKGYLERKVNRANRREHEVSITPCGKDVMIKAFDILTLQLGEVFGTLAEKDKDMLETLLLKVMTTMKPDYQFPLGLAGEK